MEKQELTDKEVTAGVVKRLLEFMELVQLLLGDGQLLSNERKNQTKVDLLIHLGRTWSFSLFWVAKKSFKQKVSVAPSKK